MCISEYIPVNILQCGICFSTIALYLLLVILPDLLALLLGLSLPSLCLCTIFLESCATEANAGLNHDSPVSSCRCPVAEDWDGRVCSLDERQHLNAAWGPAAC